MKLITLGEVVKPQGIKGELKLRMLTSGSEDVTNAECLYIDNTKLTISSFREQAGFMYIKFNEINSVQEAEKYRNHTLVTDINEVKKNLSKDQYLIEELIGKDVYLTDGTLVGKLIDVNNYGASDVITIKQGKKEILFANAENVISEVTDTKVVLNKDVYNRVVVLWE